MRTSSKVVTCLDGLGGVGGVRDRRRQNAASTWWASQGDDAVREGLEVVPVHARSAAIRTGEEPAADAVHSLDWYWPTTGEMEVPGTDLSLTDCRRQLAAERQVAEAACRAAPAGQPRLLARFESLLTVAQRYATIREEQVRSLTLGWPLLRQCVLRLGEELRAGGTIEHADDAFFLTRAELTGQGDLRELVARRRAEWERQRRLVAPLTIGKPPRLLQKAIDTTVEAVRKTTRRPAGSIIGQPASPGRGSRPGPTRPRTRGFLALPIRRRAGRAGHRACVDTTLCAGRGGGDRRRQPGGSRLPRCARIRHSGSGRNRRRHRSSARRPMRCRRRQRRRGRDRFVGPHQISTSSWRRSSGLGHRCSPATCPEPSSFRVYCGNSHVKQVA
jgi:hypothetical protein